MMTYRIKSLNIGLILLILVLFPVLGSAQETTDPASLNVYERARFELSDGNYREALRFAEQAMAMDPTNLRYRFLYGQALFKMEKFDQAETVFKELLEEGPQARNLAYVELGALYGHTKRFKEAAEYYGLAIEAFPERANLYLARGAMYMEMGDFTRADEDFQAARKVNPEIGAAVEYHRAIATYRQEDFAGTKSRLSEALTLGPDPGLEKNIRELQELTIKEEKALKPWSIRVSAAYQYDDNVALEPENEPEGVRGGPIRAGLSTARPPTTSTTGAPVTPDFSTIFTLTSISDCPKTILRPTPPADFMPSTQIPGFSEFRATWGIGTRIARI